MDLSFLNESYENGESYLDSKSKEDRKENGQYLTPPVVARYMASQIGDLEEGARILDPCSGSGVLACAVIERTIERGYPKHLKIDAFEVDPELAHLTDKNLRRAVEKANTHGIEVTVDVYIEDFILYQLSSSNPDLFGEEHPSQEKEPRSSGSYDAIIANPPYFKLKKESPQRRAASGYEGGTNIYTLFMGVSVDLLKEAGIASFIIPRSFCSGTYFGKFRESFIQRASPLKIHLFESRSENFKKGGVLQENIIFCFERRGSKGRARDRISISSSHSANDLKTSQTTREVPFDLFHGKSGRRPTFRLPSSELDEKIVQAIDSWKYTLSDFGLKVSTGPVVVFRNREYTCRASAVESGDAVPLLWMHNVGMHWVEPGKEKKGKPNRIRLEADKEDLLLPSDNYVLMRRFTTKEQKRRVVAGPFIGNEYGFGKVGLENHLNYVYRDDGHLKEDETRGLSALLGSALVDRYFRISNGSTQVNATELRSLPLPPADVIREIGKLVPDKAGSEDLTGINSVVFKVLREKELLRFDIPTIMETRLQMDKIQEAQEVLKALGLRKGQQKERAALTLLVMAQLNREDPWSSAKKQSLGITEMMDEMRKRYDKDYAPNSRETIRRRVIHQFAEKGIVVKNPDNPSLPTNSPNTHYALSDPVIRTISKYGSNDWEEAATSFLENQQSIIERQERKRSNERVPLQLPSGEEYTLSPGKHNELQVEIIEEFGQIFAPGSEVLYVGDTEEKMLHIEKEELQGIGFAMNQHDKLPDVVLYDRSKDWLFLVEAVTSHGPVTQTRVNHMERVLQDSSSKRIYVSAFLEFSTFKSFMSEIAWETEVWIANTPNHMIHFNGDRFIESI